MTNLQAFILALIILTIQTITLIVFGFKLGTDGVISTAFLFLVVNFFLCAVCDILKVVKE